MKIKINTEISNEYKELEIAIRTSKITKQVQDIIDVIQNLNDNLDKIIATQNNDIFIINTKDIILFYSEDKKNYCKTNNGIFKIKQPLYELEEKLYSADFVRISNSSIININYVESFNTDIAGTIKVKFKDGSVDYVSRRRINKVMQILKASCNK